MHQKFGGKMKKEDKINYLLLAALLIASFAYAYRGIFGLGMLAFGDLIPFPFRASHAYEYFYSAWESGGTGTIRTAGVFVLFIGFLINIFGGDAILAQKIFYFSLLPAASIMMYVFLNHFIRSQFGKFAASLAYGVNNFTLDQFRAGAMGLLFIYALFPLLLLFLFGMLKRDGENKIRDMFIFTLLMALAASFNIQAILLFAPFIVISLFVNILVERNLKYTFTSIMMLLASIILSYLLILPSVSNMELFAILAPSKESTKIEIIEMQFESVKYWYKYFFPYWYSPLTIVIDSKVLSFVLTIIAFSSLLFVLNDVKKKLALSLSIIAILVIHFSFLTGEGLTLELFHRLPILFIFSFGTPQKIMYLLPLSFLVLVAITIDEIQNKINVLTNNWIIFRMIPLLLCILIIVPAFTSQEMQFFSGDMGISKNINYVGTPHPWKPSIPPSYYHAGKWINSHRQHEGFFRTLWLPLDFETLQRILWIDPYALRFSMPHTYFEKTTQINYINLVLNSLRGDNKYSIGNLLSFMSVKYIIINLASPQTGPVNIGHILNIPYYITGDPHNFAKILDEQEDLRLVANETDFLVYENKKFVPHIAVYDRIFLIVPPINKTPNFIINYTDNLVSNPSFENGLNNWMAGSEASIDNTNYHSGNASLKITSFSSWSFVKQSLSVRGSMLYKVSFSMKIWNVKQAHVKLLWYDRLDAFGDSEAIREDQLQGGVDGTREWWRVSSFVQAPANAVKVDIFLIGGWSYDNEIGPGITWFDDVEFIHVYASTLSRTSFFSGLEMMSYFPDFNIEKQLLVDAEQISAEKIRWFSNRSDVIVFLSDEATVPIEYGKKIAFIYEAESSLIPKSGYFYTLQTRASSGYAMASEGSGIAFKKFFAPINGYYKVALRAVTNGTITIKLDNDFILNVTESNIFKWHESSPIYLKKGEYELSIAIDGKFTALDEIVIFSAENINATLKEIFGSDKDLLKAYSRKISENKYQIEVVSEKPIFVVLSESYHPAWNAYINKEKLEHFQVNLVNGFYLSKTGKNYIELTFDLQKTRNLVIAIWAITYIFFLASLIYISRKDIVHKF